MLRRLELSTARASRVAPTIATCQEVGGYIVREDVAMARDNNSGDVMSWGGRRVLVGPGVRPSPVTQGRIKGSPVSPAHTVKGPAKSEARVSQKRKV